MELEKCEARMRHSNTKSLVSLTNREQVEQLCRDLGVTRTQLCYAVSSTSGTQTDVRRFLSSR
jgi:hypothetical protein